MAKTKHGKWCSTNFQKVRLLIVGKDAGVEEDVYFIDDPDEFETPATDWCTPGQEVKCDMIFNMELPDCFPFDSQLRNIG